MHVSPTDARVAEEHGEDAPAGVLVCSLACACAVSLFECLSVLLVSVWSPVSLCVSGELLL